MDERLDAIADPPYAQATIPMRVMPTWTEERKSSGFSRSVSTIFARLLPLLARCSILLFFVETSAISDSAKNPFSIVRRAMIRYSIFEFYFVLY